MSSIMKADNLSNYRENERKSTFKAHITYSRAEEKHFTEGKSWSQRIFDTAFPFAGELNVSTNLSKPHPNVFVKKRKDISAKHILQE